MATGDIEAGDRAVAKPKPALSELTILVGHPENNPAPTEGTDSAAMRDIGQLWEH